MALNEKNPLNVDDASVGSSFSHFDLNAPLGGTYRFGEISPFLAVEAVAKDRRVRFGSGTETRSLNLKSPMMQDIKMKKAYFQVPMPALLPINWDKLYVQPNAGSDVVAEDVGTTVESFVSKVELVRVSWLEYLRSVVVTEDSKAGATYSWDNYSLACLIRHLNWLSSIFSSGSLCSQLGSNFWPLFKWTVSGDSDYEYKHFDDFYDDIMEYIMSELLDLDEVILGIPKVGGSYEQYKVICSLNDDVSGAYHQYTSGNYIPTISFRRFIELTVDNPDFILTLKKSGSNATISEELIFNYDIQVCGNFPNHSSNLPYNMEFIQAYQISCAEYLTNDKIDPICNAELYRDCVGSAIKSFFDSYDGGFMPLQFTYNGIYTFYDWLSAKYFNSILDLSVTAFAPEGEAGTDCSVQFLNYWNLIFQVRNSLRYGDYFVGAKPSPLSPINVDVAVQSGKVSMVDIAIGKGFFKLSFAAHRIGRSMRKYSKEIMHVDPPVDYHHPWYLAEVEDSLGTVETENTGINPESSSASQTVISNVRAASNRYAFETDVDIVSVIIGVMYYDVNRLYDRCYSRFNWHFDRYDMFNPLLQFTGDQDVKACEYDSGSNSSLAMAYQDKYAEYKQNYGRVFGGLVNNHILPGWVIVASDRFNDAGNAAISPSFIRSYPHEFDKFFMSLTGLSPATYFHFIVKHDNYLSMDRPMVAKPQIM